MTATHTSKTVPGYQIGDRVQIRRKGQSAAGRISSIHRSVNGVEYVVHTDPVHGGTGSVLNLWTTSDQCSFLSPAPAAGGESR